MYPQLHVKLHTDLYVLSQGPTSPLSGCTNTGHLTTEKANAANVNQNQIVQIANTVILKDP